MEIKEKPCYYTVLTSDIRYDKELSSTAKILYSEFATLSAKNGWCFASNGYIAKLYGISERQVSKLVTELAKKGYIRVENKNEKRRIFVPGGWNKSSEGVEEKFCPRVEQNFHHNNTSINNKYNNKYNNYNSQKSYDVFQDNIDHEALEKIVWEKLGK